jgi:hypothetical protein
MGDQQHMSDKDREIKGIIAISPTVKGMPAHKIGRLWKFKKEQVDKWVESGGAETSLPNE